MTRRKNDQEESNSDQEKSPTKRKKKTRQSKRKPTAKGKRKKDDEEESTSEQEEKSPAKRKTKRKTKTSEFNDKSIPTSMQSRQRVHRKFTGDDVAYVTKNPNVTYLQQRLQDFPEQSLEVQDGKALHCQACSKTLNLFKKSNVKQHVRAPTHQSNLERWTKRHKKSLEAIPKIVDFETKHNMQGRKSVPIDSKVYRQRVCSVLLEAQIPFAKLDNESFRDLLQDQKHDLGGRQGVSEWIDSLKEQEEAEIRKELSGTDIGVIFDGSARFSECYVIVVRYILEGLATWRIVQKVAAIHLLDQSFLSLNIRPYKH